MGVMIYALIIYQSRARSIRKRTGAPYDDRLGPVSRALQLRSCFHFDRKHVLLETYPGCLLGISCVLSDHLVSLSLG